MGTVWHDAIHWPEAYDPAIWPFALTYACHVSNSLPLQSTNLSPAEQWHGLKVDHEEVLSRILPWGCPSYVLESTLAQGNSIPKFKPRSRSGQFLGVSQYHSQTLIGLIRNLTTMRVSPQYHVVYDPQFTTTYSSEEDPPNEWEKMILGQKVECDFGLDDADTEELIRRKYVPFKLHNEWLDDNERLSRQEEEKVKAQRERGESELAKRHDRHQGQSMSPPRPQKERPQRASLDGGPPDPTQQDRSEMNNLDDNTADDSDGRLRWSKCERRAPSVLTTDTDGNFVDKALGGYMAKLADPFQKGKSWYDAAHLSATMFYNGQEGTVEDCLPGYAVT